MKRLLTEPELWRAIACDIAEGRWARKGLCEEITRRAHLVALNTRWRAHARSFNHAHAARYDSLTDTYGSGASGYGAARGDADTRVLMALLLALEAEEEEEGQS